MSIFDETNQKASTTTGGRSLQLFTNRLKSQRLLLSYLNDEITHQKIIFFYGDGGNGKSLLLSYLSRYCCKRFTKENWDYIQNKADREFAEEVKASREGLEIVPYAMLDFGQQPRGDDAPQQAFSALLMLQRQLTPHGFRFPLFTFACVWYLHKTNKLASTNLKGIFPSEEMDLVSTLVDSISGTAVGALAKTAVNLVSRHLKEKFELYKRKRGLSEDEVIKIQGMDAEKELMTNLPRFFAEDLNAEMSKSEFHTRVVLFFDTHEALIGSERKLSDYLKFDRERWLRLLLGSLHLDNGIVVVVAGRERPFHWSKATDDSKIPESFLDSHLVGYITREDAIEYLQKAGLTEARLQQGLVDFAQAQDNEVHPYLLGLCTDVVFAARAGSESFDIATFPQLEAVADKAKAVTDRFISYVGEMGYAVKALCAARSFDREVFRVLGQQLNFHTTEPDFTTLISFSFTWSRDKEGCYRIHDLMRRLMRDLEDEVTQAAHNVLETYYRSQHLESADDAALAEAIYHANQLDWKRGIAEWKKVFDEALGRSEYTLCGLLLGLRGALLIRDDLQFAQVSESEADYFHTLALYEAAQREYEEAVTSYNRVIGVNPNSVRAHGRKAWVLDSLGELHAILSKSAEAAQDYRDAIEAFDAALALAPGETRIHTSKGLTLQHLGELQSTQTKHAEAMISFNEAIKAHDTALNLNPDELAAHNNKGGVLFKLGALQVTQSRYDDAILSFTGAVKCFDIAINLAPDRAKTHSNKGSVLDDLGNLQVRLSRYEGAEQSYKDAVKAFDTALNLTPNNLHIHNNRGNALSSLGELQSTNSNPAEAMISYKEAIKAYDTALHLAPHYIYAHNNKGSVLRQLGVLQERQSKYDDAEQSYKDSIKAVAMALRLAPDYVNAHNNMGKVLYGLGSLQLALSKHDEAANYFADAIKAFDTVLNLAPNNIYAHNNEGHVWRILGDVRVGQSKNDEAIGLYEQAIQAFDIVLDLAPDYVKGHNNRGHVLRSLGILQANQLKHDEGVNSLMDAITAYDRALKIAPKDLAAHASKGLAFACLGAFYADSSQPEDAMKNFEAAIEEFCLVLEVAPNLTEIREGLAKTQEALGNLRNVGTR